MTTESEQLLAIISEHMFRQTVLEQLNRIERKVDRIMIDLTKITADVAAITSTEASAVALLQALKAAVDAIPTSNDPTTQAALDALSSQLETGTAGLAAAVVANTPAAPAGSQTT
jgi:hypothetical protein